MKNHRDALKILILSPLYFKMALPARLDAVRELASILTIGETVK